MRVLGIAVPLLLAQAQTAPQPGVLEGTVVNLVTRAPVPKAMITVTNVESRKSFSRVGTSDENGNFRIPDLESGHYFVDRMEAPGYSLWRIATGQFTVAEGQHITGMVLEMPPLGTISGKVVDEDGEPLVGAQLAVMTLRYNAGSKTVHTIEGATTDDRGEYRVFNLNPGRYFVNAWMPPFASQTGVMAAASLPANTRRDTPEMGYVPVFYPNAPEPSQATAIQVAGTETTGIDFRLRGVAVYHIRGKVTGYDPAGRVFVNAIPCPQPAIPGGAAEYSKAMQSGGRFEIPGVPSGTYCLMLAEEHERTVYATETVTVEGRDLENVALRAMPAFTVPGVVQVEGKPTDSTDMIVFASPTSKFGLTANNAIVDDGKFTIESMVPGAYRISANPNRLPERTYVKSIRYGDQDAPDGIVNLRAGGTVLTLVLGTDAGQLTGTVQNEDGSPVGELTVTVVPPDNFAGRTDLLDTVRVEPGTGRFRTAGLPPGDYKLYAWGDPQLPMAASPEFRQEFSGRAVSVTIAAGAQATVQLKAIPAEEIRKVKARY